MKKITKVLTTDSYITQRIDVHQNALLGDYDKQGNYFISENIIEELLNMKKVKKSTYNNSLFCVSNNLGIGELVFEVHYNKKVKNGIASAEIFLLENVYKVNGYYSNTIRTKIGTFEESVEGFIDKSYKFFKISLFDDDDGREEVVDFKNLPYPYILAKKQYENTIFKNIEDNIYEAYEEYFKEKMEALKEENTPFADAVIAEYEQDLKEVRDRFLTADKDNNYKAVNELLDKAVEVKIDDPVAKQEDIEKYQEDVKSPTEELAKDYEEAKESSDKKVRKQMPKREYEYAMQIQEDLAEHNENLPEDKLNKVGFDLKEADNVAIVDNVAEDANIRKKKEEKELPNLEDKKKPPKYIETPSNKVKTVEPIISEQKEAVVSTNEKVSEKKKGKQDGQDIVSLIKADILMDQERERQRKLAQAKKEQGTQKAKEQESVQKTKEQVVETKENEFESAVVEAENATIILPEQQPQEPIQPQSELDSENISLEEIIDEVVDVASNVAKEVTEELNNDIDSLGQANGDNISNNYIDNNSIPTSNASNSFEQVVVDNRLNDGNRYFDGRNVEKVDIHGDVLER